MLDKKLFKALRAGGLGHRAAVDLADPTGPYYLGSTTEASFDVQILDIEIGTSAWSHVLGSPADDAIWVAPVMCPLVAGAMIEVQHYIQAGAEGMDTIYPDLDLLRLNIVKMADVNGTPVAQVVSQFNASRAGGVVTLPNALSGFTISQPSPASQGFQVTVATAGHYLLSAFVNRTDS